MTRRYEKYLDREGIRGERTMRTIGALARLVTPYYAKYIDQVLYSRDLEEQIKDYDKYVRKHIERNCTLVQENDVLRGQNVEMGARIRGLEDRIDRIRELAK